MPLNFLNLTGEFRNKIHIYILLREDPTIIPPVCCFVFEGEPNILLTNKMLYHAVRSLLYGGIVSNFLTECSRSKIAQSLDRVCSDNAHIRIGFPVYRYHDDGDDLEDNNSRTLESMTKSF